MAVWNAREHAQQMAKRLKVFLCYARADSRAVEDLHSRLQRDGYAPWQDTVGILPGEEWRDKIRRAVRESDVFIACLSNGSINRSGFIQVENRFALEVANEKPPGTIFIIPVKLESCTVPDQFSELEWVELFDEPRGYERLKLALQVRADELAQP